jgi:tetratricopeptide (TPR) repeat protein
MSGERDGIDGPMATADGTIVRAALKDTLKRASTLLDQGELAQAKRLYHGVILIDPDNVEALHLLGVAYFRSGDAARAEPLISRSLQLGLARAWNFTNYAVVQIELHRYGEALVTLERALRLEPKHAPSLIACGNALRGLGRHQEAQAAYDEALRLAPGFAEAWRNRGDVLRTLGRPADALISLDQSLRIDSGNAETHTYRAYVLRDLGRREDALHSCRLALVIRPKATGLLSLCAELLTELSRFVEAMVCVDEALGQRPDDPDLLYQSCMVLDLMRGYDELLKRCDRLRARNPDHQRVWLARGNALLGLRRFDDAVEAYEKALARTPDLADALRNQAAALRMLGRYEQALGNYDRALVLTGANVELMYNRALVLQQLGHYDEAFAGYQAACDARAETAQEVFARAVALQQLRRDQDALECYERAREIDPNHADARRSQAFCRLQLGDFARGWEQHESRWLDSEAMQRRRHTDRPLWLGQEPVAGRTLLLHAEQGYGDTLQFCRYATLVAAQGASVVLQVPAALKSLLASLEGVSRVISEQDPVPEFDLQCPIMSLPLAFGTTLSTVPAGIPYLQSDPARRLLWRQRLEGHAGPRRLRVGLAWAGNPNQNNDENRSMLFAELGPLLKENATFVSLLPAVRERDVETLAHSEVVTFGAELGDFADTAALLCELDLVISVDTSVAHLAGALGKPLWVLLCRVPDWRWLLQREDSPWYPQARLFRQDKPGDWPDLVERVARELKQVIVQGGVSD